MKKINDIKGKRKEKQCSLRSLPGIGPKREEALAKLGLKTIEDLFYYFPRRYEDRSQIKPLDKLIHNSIHTIFGTVRRIEVIYPKRNINILKVLLFNETGSITGVWFNQGFLKSKIKVGMKLIVTGKVDLRYGKQIVVNDFEIYDANTEQRHSARIIPIYPGSEQINSKFIREMTFQALEKHLVEIEETFSDDIMEKYQLLPLSEAIKEIHFPTDWNLQKKARNRLAFEELLTLQLSIKKSRVKLGNMQGIKHTEDNTLPNLLINYLPFSLTQAQKRVLKQIEEDMVSRKIMSRLVQGDVGSGKTIVATWSLVKAISGGFQGALMAPTEILAEQHYFNLQKLLEPLDLKPVLLTGNTPLSEKKEKLFQILQGKSKLVIGTHALIQNEVNFNNLGLVVIDEQHRFGVKQRLALQEKGSNPDVLVMTATPIPRSLALTIYGDMDISIIDELPPGRTPIKTYHVNDNMRQKVYNLINREIKNKHQVYIVCPLVEESEKLDLENVQRLAQHLKLNVFSKYKIAVLHGRMTSSEKETIMNQFRNGQIAILITTTVIEVGVDVPNATVMVVENAERFGLAQLHQLRGRIGRGPASGYCILISQAKTEEAKARMEVMCQSNDGFNIAEQDLKIRGPGEIFGIRQHGFPDLKIADLIKDSLLLEETKKLAEEILHDGLDLKKYKKNIINQPVY